MSDGKKIVSSCIYCGCGCKLVYELDSKGNLAKVSGCKEDDISEGYPCIKGLTINEVVNKNRYAKPLIRENKKKQFREVSWKEAFDFIYKNIKDLGPDDVFLNASGKISNEDNYIIQKFARGVLKTNNIDSCCGRLCHQATIQAMNDCFGVSNLTKMENINKIDSLFIIGSNPASNYPVFFNKIMKRHKKIKLFSVQAAYNLTSQSFSKEYSDQWLTIKPGTKFVLINGLINYIIKNKKYVKSAEQIEGFSSLKRTASDFSPEFVSKECNIKEKDFLDFAKQIALTKNLGVFHGMGLTQFVNAIENVHSLLNLVLLKDAVILTLRGEINVQGAGDIGTAPDSLPNGSFTKISELEKKWKTKLSDKKGRNIIEAIMISPVKAAFITTFNPAQSLPNLDKVHKNLEKMFLVLLETHKSKTAEFANVILPIPLLIEGNGTITNGEQRIRKVNRVIEPEGLRPWQIFSHLAKYFNSQKLLNYKTEQEIFEEIVSVVPAYSKINPKKVYKGSDAYANKKIKWKKFFPEQFEGVDEIANEKYPFILTTVRSQWQYLTGEITGNSKKLKRLYGKPCVFINEHDAKNLKLKDNDLVKIESRVSYISANVKISKDMSRGLVAANIHSDKLLVNKLFEGTFDEETFTPNFKVVAVKISKK